MRKRVFVHLDSGRGYSRDLLRGIYAHNNNVSHWDIIFEPAYFFKNTGKRNDMSMIRKIRPDGCIVEFPENVSQLIAMDIPVVQVTSVDQISGVPCVRGNYESDAALAARYFKNKGFRNLAFFGIQGLEWSEERRIHFKDKVRLFCIYYSEFLLKGTEEDILSHNFEALISWLKDLPKPVAVLSCNDDFGQILINCCSTAGIKVPAEVAVLGIDNDELLCNITYPNLSSISRNHEKTAVSICNKLTRLMDGLDDPADIITDALQIVERGSTDIVATEDTQVAKAIVYITKNLHLPLNAGNIASNSSVSLKVLNAKFKAVTGNTVSAEIQMRKLAKFKQLLAANLSIKQIAIELGFADVSHISRWFSSLEGMSPTEWRRKYLG